MTATGRIQSHISANYKQLGSIQCMEYSGKDRMGRRVMGFGRRGGISTLLAVEKKSLVPVPEQWSLEDAATVPVVYGTVLYSFITRANIKRGQSVLIHVGTGGVGQAALNIALYYECDVYTTVSTQDKRNFIKKHFPAIKDSHIGNSRDTSFETLILKETKGRGVDIVLNSLSEDKLLVSLRCLAKGGKFLEIGKFDSINENPLPLGVFKRGASFHGIHLDGLVKLPFGISLVTDLLRDGASNGSIKPIHRNCFTENELETAFRFMASGKHIGKVLIRVREEESEVCVKPMKKLFKAVPRWYCDPNGSYIIIGGLGGFGLELADWLVQRGAKNLVLSSRSGLRNGYQALRIELWSSMGVKAEISTANVTTEQGCKELLEQANILAPVTAIFNLAVVLNDSLFTNQTEESFVKTHEPKALATKLLDGLSRKFCPHLKKFVVFSSVSCGKGNGGQTNYGMANSVMEMICEKRKQEGLPALAIQWGAIGDVGLVAEMQKTDKVLEIAGTLQQRISSCLEVMDQFMRQNESVVSSFVVAEKRSTLENAESVVDCVASIIGVRDVKTVSLYSTLPELGMDSMMTMEIKQTLEREFEIILSIEEVRSLTFARLHEIMSERDGSKLDVSKSQNRVNLVEQDSLNKPLLKCSTSRSSLGSHCVILLPGLEGIPSAMQTIADNLNTEVFCAQYCGNTKDYSVSGVAMELLPEISKVLSKDKQFCFVAHSYGCIIAIELAMLLEKDGISGMLILIDGSPEVLKQKAQRVGAKNPSDFEAAFLEEVISLAFPMNLAPLVKEELYSSQANIEEKIDTVAARSEIKNGKLILHGAYKRAIAILNYETLPCRIKSSMYLYRPTNGSNFAYEDEYYGLSKLADKPVVVEIFEGDHTSILQNQDLCNAIQKLLV